MGKSGGLRNEGLRSRHSGPWPDWTSRLSACGRGGKVTAKPSARACAGGSIKRGESRRSRARIVPRGHVPRIDSPGTGPRTCAILLMSTSGSELPLARIVPCGHAPRIAWGATPVLNLAAPCFQSSAYTSQNSGTGSSCSAPTASRSGPPRSSRSGTPCPPLSGPWPRPSRSRS